jgi:hypothetical protein
MLSRGIIEPDPKHCVADASRPLRGGLSPDPRGRTRSHRLASACAKRQASLEAPPLRGRRDTGQGVVDRG